MMKKSMIIVAGGSGTRMGADIPKQFIELNGKPILMHTLENLHTMDDSMELVLVLPQKEMDVWEQLCYSHNWRVPHKLTEGGDTRFLSVKNGLDLVEGDGVVGIHDGVRPFVSKAVIESCYDQANLQGAAIPVIPIVQSLRQLQEGSSKAVDRNAFRAVQTPQCFKVSIIKRAFTLADRIDYSDDATVVESTGQKIAIVDGNLENIKITAPMDLELAELIFARQSNSN